MTVEEIIKAVRLCIDEEAGNEADLELASANDNVLMDNIIRSRIGDAIRWICLYSPAELLSGTDEEGIATGILVDMPATGETLVPTTIPGRSGGYIELPLDFCKLARIRVSGWHKAVKHPISEDSDEYLQLYNEDGATATADRPVAVYIDKAVRRIEVWPSGESVEMTYVSDTDGITVERPIAGGVTETVYALPPRIKTSFIYYLAFLLLSSYNDPRATRMLEISKMNIGRNE